MPILRKIIPLGETSRGISLPKSWLDHIEAETGQRVRQVAIEVNNELKVTPYTPPKKEAA